MNITAYLILIVIWSTTPLAIKWSAYDVSFAGAIFWRIALSALLALIILRARNQKLWGYSNALRYYIIGAVGIAPNFLLVYWASLSLSSGLISVMFSATPFVMGVLSYYCLGKQVFTTQRVLALCIAIVGLLVVFADQLLVVGDHVVYSLVAMILSILSFSISSTWLQTIETDLPAFQKTTGSLCFSTPPLALAWWIVDGQLPWSVSVQGGLSIIYLSVFGSLLGFTLYYWLLHRLSAYVVSTVGMVSPVFALILGNIVAEEVVTVQLISGASLVLFGLGLYHIPHQLLRTTFARIRF